MATIVVFGATGAIGRQVLRHAAVQDGVSRVLAVVRRKRTDEYLDDGVWTDVPKVEQVVVDYEAALRDEPLVADDDDKGAATATATTPPASPSKRAPARAAAAAVPAWLRDASPVAAALCCLGTTRAAAGSADAFRRVDFDYVAWAARVCRAADVAHFSLVSSQGASKGSWFLYPKTKGEVEHYCRALQFARLSVWRPGMLDRGDDARTGERVFGVLLGRIGVDVVGAALLQDALAGAAAAAGGAGGGGGKQQQALFDNGAIKRLAAQLPDVAPLPAKTKPAEGGGDAAGAAAATATEAAPAAAAATAAEADDAPAAATSDSGSKA